MVQIWCWYGLKILILKDHIIVSKLTQSQSYFVMLTIQNDYKFTSGERERVESRADDYNAYHKLAVAVAEVRGSSIAIS